MRSRPFKLNKARPKVGRATARGWGEAPRRRRRVQEEAYQAAEQEDADGQEDHRQGDVLEGTPNLGTPVLIQVPALISGDFEGDNTAWTLTGSGAIGGAYGVYQGFNAARIYSWKRAPSGFPPDQGSTTLVQSFVAVPGEEYHFRIAVNGDNALVATPLVITLDDGVTTITNRVFAPHPGWGLYDFPTWTPGAAAGSITFSTPIPALGASVFVSNEWMVDNIELYYLA